MNFFQSIILTIFGFLAIVAVIIFSVTSGRDDSSFAGVFKIWGTLPLSAVKDPLEVFNESNSNLFKVEYIERDKETFEDDFISSLASGTGPDLIIMPESLIVENLDKTLPIPYDFYSARQFDDDFIDGASLFRSSDGIIGLPLYIDPLVMYWNKDIFSTGGAASYPTRWGEFENLVGKLTIGDRTGNISQSAVAMGSYGNISFAKEILVTLFMQSGNDLVRFSGRGGDGGFGTGEDLYKVSLGDVNEDSRGPESALRFFLDFSNPAKKVYSWNVARQNSRSAFSEGTLAIYFGLASDKEVIQKTNPHLNFDVTVLPQRDTAKKRVTFANVYAVAVTRGATKGDMARQIAVKMSGADFAGSLSKAISLPPARRDLLSLGSDDPAGSVFYSSAIIGKSWLDPSPDQTGQIFGDMVLSVSSGGKTELEAISAAGSGLNRLVRGKTKK